MRQAALDLGSNTFRLLVAEVDQSGWRALARDLAYPRLGQGLEPGGSLSPGAKEEARRVARSYVARCREMGAEKIKLAATSACRRAKDGAEFVAGLGDDLGLSVARVISGREEAALSRLGVLSRLAGPPEGALLADVGGGSTELVYLDPAGGDGVSLELGAVSLTEAYIRSDPPAEGELARLAQAVDDALAAAHGLRAERLVASAGTAATLASLRLGLASYQPDAVNNLPVSRVQLDEEMKLLASMPLAERRQQKGMEPQRADIILAGLAVLRGLVKRLGLTELTTMDAGLLEGILLGM